MKLSNSNGSPLILIVALVAALLFALYYYMVLPKSERAESLQSSVSSLNSEISTIQQQIQVIEEDSSSNGTNLFELRKKVPQSRQIDQLLLNFEELEYITKSQIVAIDFNNYDSLVSESELAPTSEEEPTPAEGEQPTEEGTEEEAPVSPIAKESLPTELKLITFNVEVASSNYQNLQKFIKEIEKLERTMHIDTIEFSLPGEEEELSEDATDVVTASIQITTFYYEGEQ